MDLKEIKTFPGEIDRHWYFSSKAKAMMQVLGETPFSTILDVGAGSCFFSKYLLAHTKASSAFCLDIHYERDQDDLESNKHVYLRRSIDSVDADLVLLMDVLEHVEDDVGLLKESIAKVPPGASFLITVPAFQFLWSEHDMFMEHKRRYTLPQIEDLVRRSGLTVIKGSYYFGAVFPIAAAIRLVENKIRKNKPALWRSQMKDHHPFVNSALVAMSQLELKLMDRNRVLGLTAFCLAK